jgi:poly(3-hydroxybutyrate) depolymerase
MPHELSLHMPDACEGPDALPWMWWRPPPGPRPRPTPLLVSVHGYTRQPLEHARAFLAHVQEAGFALLLPYFDESRHRRYQQLVHPRSGARADVALIRVLERLARCETCVDFERFALFGYSGGAQFAHRFALLHPARVAALGLGAAGWYTWPDPQWPYPRGLGGAAALLPHGQPAPTAQAWLGIPTRLWVGTHDDDADDTLRSDAALDGMQGASRLERAERWVAALHDLATPGSGVPDIALERLPGCGHSLAACERKQGLAQRMVRFAASHMSPPLPADLTRCEPQQACGW